MAEEKRICSNCKRSINATTFELHESHCLRHIKLCKVCDEPIPIKEMDEHYQENHAPKPCDLCGVHVAPDKLEEHKEQSCAEAKLECKYCELDFRRGDYPEHVEQCGSRTDFCELCNQRVMLKDMNEHKDIKCGHMKSESPLRHSDLRGMGLVDEAGNGSDSDDEVYNHYLHQGDNVPPPPYHRSHDNSMHVDPYWLQTVAEACGEDNLDALLAQNVFFENMRSVRSGDHVTNDEVGSHDSHETTEESFDDGEVNVGDREESFFPQQLPTALDNRVTDREQVPDEDEDYYFAQRLQEREVMGHSRALFDEERSREVAKQLVEEKDQVGEEGQYREEDKSSDTSQQHEEAELDKRLEEERAEISTQLQEERELLLKQIEEVREKEAALREKEIKLSEQLKKTQEETETLKLAVELQKKDLAEGHRALWKKHSPNSHLCSSEEPSSTHQRGGDRVKYGHSHFREDEPRPKTPPPFATESSEKIPCQWCNKLIPFEEVMLHQQSCNDDYYGKETLPTNNGRGYGHGLRLSEDVFRRVEEEESWEIEEFNVECSYCHVKVPINRLATHEAVCESNPEMPLKKVYETHLTSSASSKPKPDRTLSPPPSYPAPSAGVGKLLSVEKGPCEFCHEVIPLSELIKHEARCCLSRHKPIPAPPPSSPTLLQKTQVAMSNSTDAISSRRSLAIKFPAQDSVKPPASVNLDAFEKSTNPPFEKSTDSPFEKSTDPPFKRSTDPLFEMNLKHYHLSKEGDVSPAAGCEAAGKKRQSSAEYFEPCETVGEPEKKVPRTGTATSTTSKSASYRKTSGGRDTYHSLKSQDIKTVPVYSRRTPTKKSTSNVTSVGDGMSKLSLHSQPGADESHIKVLSSRTKAASSYTTSQRMTSHSNTSSARLVPMTASSPGSKYSSAKTSSKLDCRREKCGNGSSVGDQVSKLSRSMDEREKKSVESQHIADSKR